MVHTRCRGVATARLRPCQQMEAPWIPTSMPSMLPQPPLCRQWWAVEPPPSQTEAPLSLFRLSGVNHEKAAQRGGYVSLGSPACSLPIIYVPGKQTGRREAGWIQHGRLHEEPPYCWTDYGSHGSRPCHTQDQHAETKACRGEWQPSHDSLPIRVQMSHPQRGSTSARHTFLLPGTGRL